MDLATGFLLVRHDAELVRLGEDPLHAIVARRPEYCLGQTAFDHGQTTTDLVVGFVYPVADDARNAFSGRRMTIEV